MFTGIVEETGKVIKVQRESSVVKLTVGCNKVIKKADLGDSIAVNGVCLTVADIQREFFVADVMPETLNRTNLEQISPETRVNLESALTLDKFLGGHLVSGHIDGTGIIHRIIREGNVTWVEVKADEYIMQYMIFKGSVALDGMSVTVARMGKHSFWVSLIPHSVNATVMRYRKSGDLVNIECDMIGKYVKRFVDDSKGNTTRDITMEFLEQNGF